MASQADDLGDIAFLALDLQENWGVLTPPSKRAARAAVDRGHGLAVALVMKEMHIVTHLEHWYKSGEAKEFLGQAKPGNDAPEGGEVPPSGS